MKFLIFPAFLVLVNLSIYGMHPGSQAIVYVVGLSALLLIAFVIHVVVKHKKTTSRSSIALGLSKAYGGDCKVVGYLRTLDIGESLENVSAFSVRPWRYNAIVFTRGDDVAVAWADTLEFVFSVTSVIPIGESAKTGPSYWFKLISSNARVLLATPDPEGLHVLNSKRAAEEMLATIRQYLTKQNPDSHNSSSAPAQVVSAP